MTTLKKSILSLHQSTLQILSSFKCFDYLQSKRRYIP